MAVLNAADEDTVKREAVRQRPSRNSLPDGERNTPITPRPQMQAPPLVKRTYDRFYQFLDAKSAGKAAEIMRLVQFLLVGGSASLLNLAFVWLFDTLFQPSGVLPVFLVTLVATEISLLFNFVLNDRFTFRSLVSRHRTWAQRCIRFHGPASVGFALTLLISNSVHHFAHQKLVVSQAIAIVIVTMVNFFMHRHWTYREVKTETSAPTWAE